LFTGLIETTGIVKRTGVKLELEMAEDLDLRVGHSLSVNGSCLTVTNTSGRTAAFDVSRETSGRTVSPVTGMRVNLERAMPADGRLHGHFVTGHVDCRGTVTEVKRLSGFSEIRILFPESYSALLVEKGSVAVSGISFTVAELKGCSFTVAVIPETLSRTTAGEWKPGTAVNIEFDIIGKYVARAVSSARSEGSLREYLEKYQSGTG
jgi:riboflavin synthase